MSRFLGSVSLKNSISVMNRKDAAGDFIPFDCEVRSFNKYGRKGGRLITYKNVTLLPLSSGLSKKDRIFGLQELSKLPKEAKNPNHFDNKTRNIKMHTGVVRKINLNFLIAINGQQVAY